MFFRIVLCLATLLAPRFATAEMSLVPILPERPMLGGAAAKGAVIWSHGATPRPEATPHPFYLETLAAEGWDVFRLNRPPADSPKGAQAAAEHADRLRTEGYRSIVLAGQSFGGWLSFVATERARIDVVIATAPAAHGNDSANEKWQLNATNFYRLLERMNRARVMLFFFADDPYDPGDRGARATEILKRREMDALIVDRPETLRGHTVASSAGFARAYAGCIAAFIAAPKLSADFRCTQTSVRAANLGIPLPKDLALASATPDMPHKLAQFAGFWFGHYNDGREIVLAPKRLGGDGVEAVYAFGRLNTMDKSAGASIRNGAVNDNALVFGESGRPSLKFQPRPDGRLDAVWEAVDRSVTLKGVLRRLQYAPPQGTSSP
jgi:dienelactone hydrolase